MASRAIATGRSLALCSKRPVSSPRGVARPTLICRASIGDDISGSRRGILLACTLGAASLSAARIASAADFEELQAAREARKQALLEAARAKATGQPIPEYVEEAAPEPPVKESPPPPNPSLPQESVTSAPPAEVPTAPKAETKAVSPTPAPAPTQAPKKKAALAKKAKEESTSVATFDKKAMAKQRASRKAELLQKAREKAAEDAAK